MGLKDEKDARTVSAGITPGSGFCYTHIQKGGRLLMPTDVPSMTPEDFSSRALGLKHLATSDADAPRMRTLYGQLLARASHKQLLAFREMLSDRFVVDFMLVERELYLPCSGGSLARRRQLLKEATDEQLADFVATLGKNAEDSAFELAQLKNERYVIQSG